MSHIFFILMIVAAVGVFISLGLGLFVMARGGAIDKEYSNRLMRARVILQGAAIALFVLAMLAAKK